MRKIVGTGKMAVAKAPKIFKATLSTCSVLILYDEINKIGGMAHVFLPSRLKARKNTPYLDSAWGDTALYVLMDKLIEIGADKKNIIAFLIGGNVKSKSDTARENFKSIKESLEKEKIFLIYSSVGDGLERTVSFDLSSGNLSIKEFKVKTKKRKTK